MVVSDNGASAEGGPTGTTNELQFFNNAPETLEDSIRAIDELRRTDDLQPLPVGLDLGREHPVPAVEAGDLPGGASDPFLVHWPQGTMHERAARQAQRQDEAFRSYVQQAAGDSSLADQLMAKLTNLLDRGVISAEEFEREIAKVLA
jgi:hypothetical protein